MCWRHANIVSIVINYWNVRHDLALNELVGSTVIVCHINFPSAAFLHWQGSQYKVRSTAFQRLKNQVMLVNPRKPVADTSACEWNRALRQ